MTKLEAQAKSLAMAAALERLPDTAKVLTATLGDGRPSTPYIHVASVETVGLIAAWYGRGIIVDGDEHYVMLDGVKVMALE